MTSSIPRVLNLHAGDWVEVRRKEEILSTLDARGCLEGLPFMPEMFAFCGRRFRVFKRAHKTCDTIEKTGGRRMANAVHLEDVRCDGAAHGGCEATCMIFWKEAWLRRVSLDGAPVPDETVPPAAIPGGCSEPAVWKAARIEDPSAPDDPTFVCQATQLLAATTPLKWWDVRQYIEDFTSGNVGLRRLVCSAVYSLVSHLSEAGVGLGRPIRWLYDRIRPGGVPFPRRRGSIGLEERTPSLELNLQPGEMVRVRSFSEILATLNKLNKNRGLYFDAESVPYCGRSFRVLKRVTQIVNEKTGKMMRFKNASVILEGAYCQARYSGCRMMCPRAVYPMWREIWLERVDRESSGPPPGRQTG
ncbi:MAG TPA: hypothetical protein VNO52_04675 [Methylomirabilota bacterium]|nr:hypothetical protein [Methylomirabilota bacterium]